MKEKILKNKTIVIVVAAIVLCGIGFAAGMMIKTSLAHEDGNYIGADKAKTIALESVGVSPSKATFTKVEVDRSDDPATYEIEFYTASNEYDFEIHAFTGDILEKESKAIASQTPQAVTPSTAAKETTSVSSNAQQPSQSTQTAGSNKANNSTSKSSSDYIGVDKAKSIAFNHAGVSASSATVTKAKLDSDDGVKTYEIEFIAGNREYEYEINAYNGKIMDHDWEHLDDHDHDD